MLTEQEIAAVGVSIRKIAHAAADSLRQMPDAARAVAFVANLHRGVDEVTARAAATGPAPECKAGCTSCCKVQVEATEPEVFHIARTLRLLPSAQLTELVDKLRAYLEQPMTARVKRSCPLLVDDLCSIYEVRPATCRKAHSLSASQCRNDASSLPQNLALLLDAETLIAGTAEGYRVAKLSAAPHELVAAVLTALTDETAEMRWYGGELVF